MLYYSLLITTTLLSVYFFIKDDYYSQLEIKYKKWGSLNNLVSTKYSSPLKIQWISFCMICESIYISLLQYLNKSVKKIDKNRYEITYIINDRLYKTIIKPTRGPTPIVSVLNENNHDITDKITPYLGPNNDWNGTKFYPNFFNCSTLTIELLDGTVKVFNNSETITF